MSLQAGQGQSDGSRFHLSCPMQTLTQGPLAYVSHSLDIDSPHLTWVPLTLAALK